MAAASWGLVYMWFLFLEERQIRWRILPQPDLFMFKPRLLSSLPVSQGHQKALKPDSTSDTSWWNPWTWCAYHNVHFLGDFVLKSLHFIQGSPKRRGKKSNSIAQQPWTALKIKDDLGGFLSAYLSAYLSIICVYYDPKSHNMCMDKQSSENALKVFLGDEVI